MASRHQRHKVIFGRGDFKIVECVDFKKRKYYTVLSRASRLHIHCDCRDTAVKICTYAHLNIPTAKVLSDWERKQVVYLRTGKR